MGEGEIVGIAKLLSARSKNHACACRRGRILFNKVSKLYIQGGKACVRILFMVEQQATLAVPRRTVSGNFPNSVLFSGVVNHGKPIQNQNR